MSQQEQILSVSDFNRITDECLRNLGTAKIVGEISQIRRYSHLYLTVKDENASLECLMFASALANLPFTPKEGMQVVITGHSSLYQKNSQFKFLISTMERQGRGLIMERLAKLKEQLQREGVFDLIKRSLPLFPDRVGVITSAEGRVVHDIAMTLERRMSGIEIRVYNAKVQGEGAPQSLIKALEYANQENVCDVLIIGRGGGSFEDLLAFSDEALVRAVAHSKIPIISAVGHEPDVALTDFAADVRAATPTAAAELVSRYTKEDLKNALLNYERRLDDQILRISDPYKMRLASALSSMAAHDPDKMIMALKTRLQSSISRGDLALYALLGNKRLRFSQLVSRLSRVELGAQIIKDSHRLTALTERAGRALETQNKNLHDRLYFLFTDLYKSQVFERLQDLTTRFAGALATLKAVNPLSVLSRGYSVTLNKNDHELKFNEVQKGEIITTRLKDGIVKSEVVDKKAL